jgi:hypothetical protein
MLSPTLGRWLSRDPLMTTMEPDWSSRTNMSRIGFATLPTHTCTVPTTHFDLSTLRALKGWFRQDYPGQPISLLGFLPLTGHRVPVGRRTPSSWPSTSNSWLGMSATRTLLGLRPCQIALAILGTGLHAGRPLQPASLSSMHRGLNFAIQTLQSGTIPANGSTTTTSERPRACDQSQSLVLLSNVVTTRVAT